MWKDKARMPNSPLGEKPEEKEARVSLEGFLVHALGPESVVYVQGANPPDYVFTIRGQTFSVEATTLYHDVDVDGRARPAAFANAKCDELRQALKKSFASVPPNRSYWVRLRVTPDKEQARMIVQRFGKYLTVEDPPRYFRAYPSDPPKFYESPLAEFNQSKGTGEIVVTPPDAACWEAETVALKKLQQVIDEKIGKLRDKPDRKPVKKPWILAVLHRNGFVDCPCYKNHLADLKGIEEFHSIFIARHAREGYFLTGPWSRYEAM